MPNKVDVNVDHEFGAKLSCFIEILMILFFGKFDRGLNRILAGNLIGGQLLLKKGKLSYTSPPA